MGPAGDVSRTVGGPRGSMSVSVLRGGSKAPAIGVSGRIRASQEGRPEFGDVSGHAMTQHAPRTAVGMEVGTAARSAQLSDLEAILGSVPLGIGRGQRRRQRHSPGAVAWA